MEKTESPDDVLNAYKTCTDEKKKRVLYLNIIESGMRFVKKIAAAFAAQSCVSNEDLVQVGSIGLIKAIDFFDKDKNAGFKTYAVYFIKGEIQHYLRDKASIIKAPRGEALNDILSLDRTFVSDEDEVALVERIPAGDYQEFLNSCEDKITIASAIERLPDDLRRIIELSYYNDLSQREISERMGLSQMQVSRKLKKALNKMYGIIEGK